jgi:uncharacterized membrane protein
MEWIKLLGIVIVIIGFAMKKDAILIIMVAAIVTALTGGLGIKGFLTTLGDTFVANRAMAIFILILLVTGTLERNGLKESAAKLIEKLKVKSAGSIIGAYGILRGIFGAFNASFGGVAGFVRPIVIPMAEGTIEAKGEKINEDYMDEVKGMASGMENISWFFCQVLFIGGAGGLLVQSTLKPLGYDVTLVDLAKVEIPVAIFAVGVSIVYYYLKDRRLVKKYYGNKKKEG